MSKETKLIDTKKEIGVPENPTSQEPTEIPTNLGLDDISKLIKLIDIASEKGIFKPADFVSIGQTYLKLVQILQSVAPRT